MAIYRQVHISFWQDEFVLNLTPEEKFFYLYLMTNSKTSQCGIYEIPKKIVQFETGYNEETVEKLMKRFIEYKKILYDDATKEIILLNWMKHNKNTSPKVKDRIKKELQDVKSPDFINIFEKACKQYGYSMDTVSIPKRNKNQNQNKNQNKNNKKDYEHFFEMLWEIYPRKRGKGQVTEAQKKRLYEIGWDKLENCIAKFKRDMEKEKRPLEKYQYGSTFFNSGYIDYLEEKAKPQSPKEPAPFKYVPYEP